MSDKRATPRGSDVSTTTAATRSEWVNVQVGFWKSLWLVLRGATRTPWRSTPNGRHSKMSDAASVSGAELIAAERQRQVNSEGWTAEHDDEHSRDEIARAAAVYALPREARESIPGLFGYWAHDAMHDDVWRDGIWPWPGDFKPTKDRVRELVKAGALIAAEIDRLQRRAAA